MADENIKTTLQFQADITDFKSAMSEARAAIGLANSQFKEASSGLDDWSSSTDGLKAKLDQLATVEAAQKRQLDVLKTAYNKVVEEQGEASAEAIKLKTQINNQQAAINKTAKEHRNFAAKLEEVEQGASGAEDALDNVSDAAKDAGEAAKDAGEGWTIFKDVVADMISNVISGAVDSIISAAEATREYRREIAQMAQNAKDSGQSIDNMKKVLADVSSVTGETDAAMEGLNMLMASGLDTSGIELAADTLTGAATKFDGLKFEGLAEGLQESLAVGEAVGPFAELIERTGGNLEAFNEGMANCTTTAEKQQYALQWLSESGLKEVHDSYVQNNADLVAAEQAQFRYNDSLAAVGAVLEPVQTSLQNLAATVMEKVAPVIQNVIQWTIDNLPVIAPIVSALAAAFGVLAAAMAIEKLISGVQKAFLVLNGTMATNPIVLIVAAIAALVAAFVYLWNNCEEFRNFWINMWEGIKSAFSAVVNWIKNAASNIAQFFVNAWNTIKNAWSNSIIGKYFGQIWETIKGIFSVVKSVLSGNFSGAWEAIKGIFSGWGNFFSGLWSKVTSVFSKVGSWFGSIFQTAWRGITNAFANVSSFFSGIWDKITSVFSISGMLSIGRNLVEGLWNGISGAFTWITEKITGWVGNVMDFIKGLFGIHSPSAVMRDEVGKMLGLGMAEGIKQSVGAVNSAVRGLGNAAMKGLDGGFNVNGAGVAGSGGKTIIFNQTNNSPRALSRLEIYRQTNNALAYAGGV